MSELAIFLIGCFASSLCLAFLVVTIAELRRLGKEPSDRKPI
jgi:hypothetical protein